jgi:hypothetical protein
MVLSFVCLVGLIHQPGLESTNGKIPRFSSRLFIPFALSLIHAGMTSDEVERILGQPTTRFVLAGTMSYVYNNGGFRIVFEWDCPRRRISAPDLGSCAYIWDLNSISLVNCHHRVARVEYQFARNHNVPGIRRE